MCGIIGISDGAIGFFRFLLGTPTCQFPALVPSKQRQSEMNLSTRKS
ncbi:hypothetical protein [Mesorhizobium sp. 2RAF45]